MSSYYEGRDLLRTKDIQGSQSSTTLKNRNIDQEMMTPQILKHVPEQYQRQAEMKKHIRNPHFNDFRYDLNQQHPHFAPHSVQSDYRDSLDTFKSVQEQLKSDLIKNNSNINYDFIRSQKNKNSFNQLNPPFANLHSDITDHKLENLSSPINQYFKASGHNNMNSNQNPFQSVSPDLPYLSPNISMMNKSNAQPVHHQQQINIKNIPLALSQSSLEPLQEMPMKSSRMNNNNNNIPPIQIPQSQEYFAQAQQPDIQSQSPLNNLRDNQMNAEPYKQLNSRRPSEHNISPLQQQQSPLNSSRKTYKPYNIISHNRYVPYTPKYDMPDLVWDKYDRQMFKNFEMKSVPPVEIVRTKNRQLNEFSDYSTWNQRYGQNIV